MTLAQLVLPSNVVSKADVSRLAIEFERVDSELNAAGLRAKQGNVTQNATPLSDRLQSFIDENTIQLADAKMRTEAIKSLRELKEKVPVIHMTFATVAEPESLQLLAHWLRTSIHPQAVLEVGLQPSLVAGVYLRTPNHVHDLSLRAVLQSHRGLLIQDLEAARGK
jgi:hypothetical protein